MITLTSFLTWLVGPGLVILIAFAKRITKRLKTNDIRTEAVSYGVQALLRDRLYQSYDYYMTEGYAPVYAKENFDNMYTQYHNLGLNGVMDNHYKNFMSLPDKQEDVQNEKVD